jgi:hypothetical protein
LTRVFHCPRLAIDIAFLDSSMNPIEPFKIGIKLLKLARCNSKEEKSSHMKTRQPVILSSLRSRGMETRQFCPRYLLVNDMHLKHAIYHMGERTYPPF